MLRIINSENLSIAETVTNYISVIFNLNFSESGDFTLTLPSDFVSENIIKNNYILWKENLGTIKYISKTAENITVKGCDIKGLLKQRICRGEYSGRIETVMKNIVSENITGNRAFPCFFVAPDGESGEEAEYISNGETINSALKTISEKYGVGWEIKLKENKLVFDVVFPSASEAYYTVRHGNISGCTYELNALSETNTLYNYATPKGLELKSETDGIYLEKGSCYLSDGKTYYENAEKKKIFTPSPSTAYYYYIEPDGEDVRINRYSVSQDRPTENMFYLGFVSKYTNSDYASAAVTNAEHTGQLVFVNGENGEKTGINRNEAYISELSPTDELLKSDKLEAATENATADIVTYGDYNTKWKLGDTVKIRLDVMGQTIIFEKNITAVQLIDEANNKRIIPTFGKTKSILKKLLGGI